MISVVVLALSASSLATRFSVAQLKAPKSSGLRRLHQNGSHRTQGPLLREPPQVGPDMPSVVGLLAAASTQAAGPLGDPQHHAPPLRFLHTLLQVTLADIAITVGGQRARIQVPLPQPPPDKGPPPPPPAPQSASSSNGSEPEDGDGGPPAATDTSNPEPSKVCVNLCPLMWAWGCLG